MDEAELRELLASHLTINQDDHVYVSEVSKMKTLSLAANKELLPYRVSFYEDKGDQNTLVFFCMAEDEDHAEEQTINAYPNCEITHTTQITPEDYPHDIN